MLSRAESGILARALAARIPLSVRLAVCLTLVVVELLLSPTSLQTARTLRTFDGGYFPAAFGSRVEITADRDGPVAVQSGNLEVAGFAQCVSSPCAFTVLGDATYTVRGQVGFIHISVADPKPRVPDVITGSLLLLACVLGLLSIDAPADSVRRTAPPAWRPSVIAAGVALAAALVFPPYLHNDQLGHGVLGDWGYLGWGYLDTVSSSLGAVMPHAVDLSNLPSDGKTVLLPALVGILGGWLSPVGAGYFWSLVLTALTAAGVASLGSLLWRSDHAGALAGALFAVQPMTLGYALSFYQELGVVAFFTWGILFAVRGVQTHSRTRLVVGGALVALAVCAKSPVLAIDVTLLTFGLLFALGVRARTGAALAATYGALALLTSVATWPFLWVDTSRRIAFAFGARIIVDQTIHQSSPLASRLANATLQTALHTGPICLLLTTVCIVHLARRRDWCVLTGLLGAIGAGIALVVPTSMYLEHYWFYTIPALPLLAGGAFVPIAARAVPSVAPPRRWWNSTALVAALAAVELVWALIYWPYPSAASIGCFSLQCTSERWGVSEPVYGLREAAAWIRTHTGRDALIGALSAPHILQDEVEGRFVRSLWMPPDVRAQQRTIRDSGVEYIVGNAWSQANHDVPRTNVTVAWAGPARFGSPIVYSVRHPSPAWLWPDAPNWSSARTLIPPAAPRIVAFPRQDSYLGRLAVTKLVTPSQPLGPAPPEPAALVQLGGGVLLTQDAATLARELDLAEPLATDDSGNGALALPSLDSLDLLRTIALSPAPSPYGGDHRFAAFLGPSSGGYALKYLYVRVHARVRRVLAGQMNGNVALSCVFGKATSEYLTVISATDSVAWVPMDRGYVGSCDPTSQRIAVAVDVYIPAAVAVAVSVTPAIDRSAVNLLLGAGGTAPLFSQVSPGGADAVASRDPGAPTGLIAPPSVHQYDAVASKRVMLGPHAALLVFLPEPGVRRISGAPEVYCLDACRYDTTGRRYSIAAGGRIIWAWSLDAISHVSLVRVDFSGVRPGMREVSLGAFMSFGSRSCYTDLRDFARNGFIYLNLDDLRRGPCARLPGGRLGLTLFPRSPITVVSAPPMFAAADNP